MTGEILGFDSSTNTGAIKGDDAQRYEFLKEEFKESASIQKGMKVDFAIENDKAKAIYLLKATSDENKTIMGLIAVLLTFFLGFIGTFISRLVLAKEPVGNTVVPTLIHLVITVLFIIPVFGWLIYVVGTAYYMYKNYMLTVETT